MTDTSADGLDGALGASGATDSTERECPLPQQRRASKASAASSRQHHERNLEVMRKLWQIYSTIVMPIERKVHLDHFGSTSVTEEEFEAKPQVLLLGQYSTGKTTMIKWLIGSESSHFDIRPQPSTDKFMAVVHGDDECVLKGNAAATLRQLPYQGLSVFGGNFLKSFEALVTPSDLLRELTFIDTPGVLSGNKQRLGRVYDYARVVAWMAQRADLIILTFDAHKLDISDEFQEVMEVLKPFADKTRCVLNKADQIDATNLVKVYGALLWNIGKVLRTPEVTRVYVSSFWDQDYRFKEHGELFEEDKSELLHELYELPNNAWHRKIDQFAARVRRLMAVYAILCHIRSQKPFKFRCCPHKQYQTWVCDNLERLVAEAARIRGIAEGDLPDLTTFRQRLATFDMALLPAWDSREEESLKRVIDEAIPELMDRRGGITHAKTRMRKSPSPTRCWPFGKRRRTD